MSGGVEPGWYPDPHDPTQARYWSGVDWADRTRRIESAPATESTRVAPPWPVLVMGALGAIGLGVLVALLLTRGDDGSSEQIEAVAAPAPDPTEATTETRPTPNTTAAIAGASSVGQWIVVLASVEQASDPTAADARHGEIEARFPEAEQLDSTAFESLRPGYFVSFVGPFATPEATVAFCQSHGLSVPSDCYGRFLSHDPQDASLIADG